VAAWTVTDSDARTPVSRLGTTTWGRPPTGTNRGAALTATGRVHSPATRATGCTSRTSTSTAAPGGRFATSWVNSPAGRDSASAATRPSSRAASYTWRASSRPRISPRTSRVSIRIHMPSTAAPGASGRT
jgi:hypothetical protein